MEIFIIALAAFFTSILTFLSTFGLGTILTPVFAIFFPVDLAIALTGVVHFLNNVVKLTLIGNKADKGTLLRFGLPAIAASFIGAWLLLRLGDLSPLYEYSMGLKEFSITPVKAVIAFLLIIFVILELLPFFKQLKIDRKKLPIGGFLSGFFGGLSGLQGALRSIFLLKSGLSKEAYIGTAVVLALFVDVTRLSVYATRFINVQLMDQLTLVIAAVAAAIAGTLAGNMLLKKISFKFIHRLIAILLVGISLALGLGFI